MGRVARGVKGITLGKGDKVVAMTKAESDAFLLVVSEKGFGKRTPLNLDNYRQITRGGKGVYTMRCNEKTGSLVSVQLVRGGDELMIITRHGIIIRINADDISQQGRMTQGVTLINLGKGDSVMDVAKVMTKDDDDSTEETINIMKTQGDSGNARELLLNAAEKDAKDDNGQGVLDLE
jgi:DNA gyrase subunit A